MTRFLNCLGGYILTPLFLTKTGGFLGPIADLMGIIMDLIFRVTSSMGVLNVGLCIIIFTIVTRIIMYPLSYKQAKSQKLMAVIQPEILAIQAKYKGKENDQQAMLMQNAEIKAVYEKYGTSMTGGCVQLIIQMPIIFALYRVILNIPAYVPSVKVYFENVVSSIGGSAAIANVNEFAHSTEALTKIVTTARIANGTISTENHIIDFLYNLNPDQWSKFAEFVTDKGMILEQAMEQVFTPNVMAIQQMNEFLGINLATSPSAYGLLSPKAWIIPVLAGLSQYLATKLMQSQTPQMDDENNPTAGMMKGMNIMMPLMSVFFCFSFASGVGIYWVASSLIMGIQQYFLNKHMNKIDMDELIKKNIDKANAKRAKKGLPPINEKTAEDNYKKMQAKMERMEAKRQVQLDETKVRIEEANKYYKTDSIADRAKMVQQYNEKHGKK